MVACSGAIVMCLAAAKNLLMDRVGLYMRPLVEPINGTPTIVALPLVGRKADKARCTHPPNARLSEGTMRALTWGLCQEVAHYLS